MENKNEKVYLLKDNNYYYNLDIADLYYFLYDKEFDYDKIENRKANLDSISELDFDNNYIVHRDYLEQLEIKAKTEDLNIKEIIENYDNKEMIHLYESQLLKINDYPVKEEITTRLYTNDLEIINLEDSIFNDLKKQIQKNPFVNSFECDYIIKRDVITNEEFISLTIDKDNNFIMDRSYLENMIEKYNEKEFDYGQISPPNEKEKEVVDISETNREEYQSHFDLAF